MEALFNRLGKVGMGLAAGGFLMTRFFFVCDGGERALIYDKFRGVRSHVYNEGMHFYIPII